MREVEIEVVVEYLGVNGATEEAALQASFNDPENNPKQITTLEELDQQIARMIEQFISPGGIVGCQVRVNGLLYRATGTNEEEIIPFYELTKSKWSEVQEEFINVFKAYQLERTVILLDHEIGGSLHRLWEDSNVWVFRDPKAR